MEEAGVFELFPYSRTFAELVGLLCHDGLPTQKLCVLAYYLAYGDDSERLNKVMFGYVLDMIHTEPTCRNATTKTKTDTLTCKGKDKVVLMLNQAPRHEDVLGEWRHSSMNS
jgi:hypothetical protein